MPKVLIVDDHHLVRTGLRNILAEESDIEVVAEAESGEEAIRLNRELAPDVILMDISMPGMSGVETTKRILRATPGARVIVLTALSEQPFPSQLLNIGASGYLTKACDASELLQAIRRVLRGERHIGAEVAQQLAISLLPEKNGSPFAELSSREMEVALMLTQGMTLKAIGDILSRSPKTIATYKYRVYDKVGVRNEVELLKKAIRYGVVEQGV